MAQLFTRLLLATEHTNHDAGAENMAIALAQRCQLPLAVVLPLVSNPEYEALAPQIAAQAERAAASSMAQLQAQAGAQGVNLDLHVRRGEEPYQEIAAQAQALGSDLIIIRRRGKRSFFANLLVGEMVSKVVAHAPCHVLIVPRQAHMWQRKVLVAAEASAQGQQLVRIAAAVASQCALPLHVVVVVTAASLKAPAAAFVAEMCVLGQALGVSTAGEVRVGQPYAEILAVQPTHGADLIVMGSRGEASLQRALVGGVAQKVMGLSEVPVMVLHV